MDGTVKNSVELGALIRRRREELRVTQKDLALSCGTGLRFIIELEKGKATCQLGKALSVLSALGLVLSVRSSEPELPADIK